MDTATLTALFTQVSEAVFGAQTEIVIFILAFFIHGLVFGRLRVRSKKPPSTNNVPASASAPSSGKHAPPRSSHAKELSRLADGFSQMEDATEVAAELKAKIQGVPSEDTVESLVGLLEGASTHATPQLLAAVRGVLQERGLTPDPDLGELMLRCYVGLRLLEDFDEVYCELTAAHGALPSIGVLGLKAALRTGTATSGPSCHSADFRKCLDRMDCLRPLWNKDSPSAGFITLLQQLVRFAAQEQSLSLFLERLQQIDLLKDALDTVLVECVHRGSALDVEEVLKCSQKQGLQFGEPAYCALIKRSQIASETVRLFTEATRILKAPCNILVAASEWALERSDEGVANLVLENLPTKPPGEAVGKLLRFYSKAHGNAFQLYVQKFKDVDLSADIDAMRLITMLTLQEGGPSGKQALEGLLAAVSETARVSLLKAFASEKELAAALEVLRASPGKGSCLYNAAIDACIDCRNIDDAETVMQEAVARGIADTISYNTIVKAYVQAKRPREARQAVAAMRIAGLVPNSVTYNELLDAVAKTSLEDAWQVLADMRNAGLYPNRITCSILLKAVQARTKPADVERVIATLYKLEEELDEVLLCSVVDACIRARRAELLIPILKRQRTNVKTTHVKGAHTYGSIIRAYGFVQDIAAVWETWREMRTRHIAPNAVTLGCMTEALTQNGEAEGAYELINEMRKDEKWAPLINAVIYCSVLKGFSHQKRFDRLWAVYEEMLSHKLEFSIVTFNTLVDACSRNNEMKRIPALLKDMVAQGIPPNIITYSAIVKGYCQEDRIAEAFSVVDGMKQTTDFQPDEIMFNTLLDGCARQRMYDRGMGVLEEMQRANIVPTNFTLSVLVKLASRSRKLDRAFELCQEISAKYRFKWNVQVYSNLVNACLTNKDLSRAMDVFEKQLSERVRPEARGYTLLLRALVAAGQANDAAGLIRAATGLNTVHPRLQKYDARLLQPQGGLPPNIIAESLEGIAGSCRSERLAVSLLKDLKEAHVKLDPKLQFRLATSVLVAEAEQVKSR